MLWEQISAWVMYREGWGATDIAQTLGRLPTEARFILNGDPEIAPLTRRAA